MKERIKKIRESLNLSQKEFAQELGVISTAISKYERGEVKPASDFLDKLYRKFHVNLNWLISGKGQMFLVSKEKPKSDFDIQKNSAVKDLIDNLSHSPHIYQALSQLVQAVKEDSMAINELSEILRKSLEED